jgi:hypothetical protein
MPERDCSGVNCNFSIKCDSLYPNWLGFYFGSLSVDFPTTPGFARGSPRRILGQREIYGLGDPRTPDIASAFAIVSKKRGDPNARGATHSALYKFIYGSFLVSSVKEPIRARNTFAVGINDFDQIVGVFDPAAPNSQRLGFLASPIPEPSMFLLLAGAVFGFIPLWRLKKKAGGNCLGAETT